MDHQANHLHAAGTVIYRHDHPHKHVRDEPDRGRDLPQHHLRLHFHDHSAAEVRALRRVG